MLIALADDKVYRVAKQNGWKTVKSHFVQCQFLKI